MELIINTYLSQPRNQQEEAFNVAQEISRYLKTAYENIP